MMDLRKVKNQETIDMWNNAGVRERYAMDNGNKRVVYINNNKCYKFTYSKYKEYQDGNGAIYDTVRKCWIS